MARITGTQGESIFQLRRWRGLNESPTGDTKLQLGDATICDNWRVTRDGNLLVRPGTHTVLDLADGTGRPVKALWYGYVMGERYLVAACNGKLWQIDEHIGTWTKTALGSINTIGTVHMFGFSEKLYIMTGREYKVWDGTTLRDVDGYRPVVAVGVPPSGGGTLLEQVNKLNGMRRVFLSPDGKSNTFQIPETGLLSVDWVKDRATDYVRSDYTTNLADGIVIFNPQQATETFNIGAGSQTLYALNNLNVASIERVYAVITGAEQATETFVLDDLDPTKQYTLTSQGITGINSVTALISGYISYTLSPAEYTYDADTHKIQFSQDADIWYPDTTISVNEELAGTYNLSQDEYTYNAALHEIQISETADIWYPGTTLNIVENLAVPEGTNTIEVAYTASGDYSLQIKHMRYAELFSGATDNRVFVYGDGSNLVYYSGVEYDGSASAEYFPDMNVLDVGDANTPVTALIKHYSRLLAFKEGSAYTISARTMTLADGSTTPSFYVTPVNRNIGNAAPGQVQLVLNDPITINGRDIYRWKNNNSYSSNLTLDERQAQRISDRVADTVSRFEAKSCIMYDHNYDQEFYVVFRDRALVYNYAADAWYTYSNFPARCFAAVDKELYIGDNAGHLRHVSETWRSDDGEAIHAIWQSGSFPFGAEWLKKYTLRVFIGMKPVRDSLVRLYTNSDREVGSGNGTDTVDKLATLDFGDMDFADFTFSTTQVPRIVRHKLKQKKYAYMQIILESNSATTTAQLTSMDITVRNTVYMKTIK